MMPLIIVGGIWSGVFTPTESAAVAVVYGTLVSLFLYRDITVRDLPRLLVNAFQTSATVMLVIGATGALAWLITAEQVAVQMAAWIKIVAAQQWTFLLMVNVALLLLGIFIEPLPAMLLTAPLLLPIAQKFGIDLVHLGVVITANLAIALYTPPVGVRCSWRPLAGAGSARSPQGAVPSAAGRRRRADDHHPTCRR
ncbi:MAG: TRAP transporter large permease subunit [Betaproteobacteria bacterium]|nr:TRAP transporter large permease subunit [Betaproteobacteria bacterium]